MEGFDVAIINWKPYRHTGFWQPMDTLRDKVVLEEMGTNEKPRLEVENNSCNRLTLLIIYPNHINW